MIKRGYIYAGIWVLLVFGGAAFLGLNFNPLKVINSSRYAASEITIEERAKLKEIYDVNFIMKSTASGNIANYLPRMEFIDIDEVKNFAALFDVEQNFTETENSYGYSNDKGKLTISKFGSHLIFESKEKNRTTNINAQEAAIIAEEFMSERLIYFSFEEAITKSENGAYEVMFINRIGNLPDYAFPNKVTLDLQGNILVADYYFLAYDKLDNFPIESMSSAFYKLPYDLDIKVDLKKCSLVYYYLNSIVQPCYLFEGMTTTGETFKSFVPATIYM